MSAKHKRPFYVFAAVAAVCCLVLVTGIRGSRADDGHIPVVADGSSVAETRAPITPIPDAPHSSSPNPDHTGSVEADPRWGGGFEITTPGDESLTDADGGDTESGSDSGLIALPPFDLPIPPTDVDPGDVTVPPLTDGTDGKGRGDRGGKKNKNKNKDNGEDEQADDSAAEAEEEVDPDVYGLPEDEVDEGQEEEGDHLEGPDDPETTP